MKERERDRHSVFSYETQQNGATVGVDRYRRSVKEREKEREGERERERERERKKERESR